MDLDPRLFELTADGYRVLALFWMQLKAILNLTVPGTTMTMLQLIEALWLVVFTGRIAIGIASGGFAGGGDDDNGSE